ncbi:rhodanese-like domain-containing protein [Halorutilales archaeon Cl-col2-1]
MVEQITTDELHDRIESGEKPQIIDIRSEEEYEKGHIPDAENIPLDDLPLKIGEQDWDDDVVVVCKIGESSVQGARLIKAYEGVSDDAEVASMEGGMEDWEYETESE